MSEAKNLYVRCKRFFVAALLRMAVLKQDLVPIRCNHSRIAFWTQLTKIVKNNTGQGAHGLAFSFKNSRTHPKPELT